MANLPGPVIDYNDSPAPIQAHSDTSGNRRRLTPGIVGLLFPGGGQILRFQPVNAGLVLFGVIVPLYWFATLITQRANMQLRPPGKSPAWTLWDGEVLTHFQALKGLQPELIALPILALAIHLLAAWVAYTGGVPAAVQTTAPATPDMAVAEQQAEVEAPAEETPDD